MGEASAQALGQLAELLLPFPSFSPTVLVQALLPGSPAQLKRPSPVGQAVCFPTSHLPVSQEGRALRRHFFGSTLGPILEAPLG